MLKYLCIILITILPLRQVNAQTIKGTLKHHTGQQMILMGFSNYKTVELSKTQADSLGHFTLNYPDDYKGMALLKTEDNNSLVLLLGKESLLTLQGTDITETDSLQLNASENKTFFNYAMGQGYRTNATNAWNYLDKLYKMEGQFVQQKKVKRTITKELQRIEETAQKLVDDLDKNSYLRWFIPYRKFIQEMPTIIRTETERIPASIALFRTTDFNHPHWKTSGIFQEFIEKHYFMLENSSGTVAEKQEKMNESSLHLIQNLESNQVLLNDVVAKLFTFLEERSLFIASEFLALQVLNGAQCEIEEKTANKLEKYRNLKIGGKAPDILLSNAKKLSDYKQPILLVFGKSDCPHCKEGALELLKYYAGWKTKKNVEVVYVSLDTDKKVYQEAYQNAPWPMFCDFKGWDSKAVKDYHIWGTPSYFLLDKELTILAHINSVAHANAWVTSRL